MAWGTEFFPRTLILAVAIIFSSATAFGQDDEEALRQGQADYKKGDYDQSLADFNKAVAAHPLDAKAYFKRAYLYMATGGYDLAISDLNQAIQIDPQFKQAYFRRAFVLIIQRKFDEAVADLTKVIQIDPNYTRAYYRCAYAYMIEGKYDQALDQLNRLIVLDPHNRGAYLRRASVYVLKGDYYQAIGAFEQIIRDNPQETGAYNKLAWLLATCPQAGFRNGPKAVELGTKACDITQWHFGSYEDTLATAYALTGDFASAVKLEKLALDYKSPDDVKKDENNRLALYESDHIYQVDKYDPKFSMFIN